MKPKVVFKYDNPEAVASRGGVVVERRIARMFAGIRIPLKEMAEKAAAKVGPKNPAYWIAAFQADKIVITLKVGSDVQVVGQFELGNVVDAKRRKEIADSLKDEGVLDGSEVAQFMRRHPDKSRLAELRQAVADKLKAIETLKSELMTLKAELAGSGG